MTHKTTGGRKAPTFTDTQALRNRQAAKEAAEREGRLLGILMVECSIFVIIILAELFAR
jgi:hypothetical protein